MSKDDIIKAKGTIIECLPNAMFKVEIEGIKKVILATISGKIRRHNINILKFFSKKNRESLNLKACLPSLKSFPVSSSL
jgi:translation initiation factor IF-1